MKLKIKDIWDRVETISNLLHFSLNFKKFKNLKFHERRPYIWKFGCSNQNWICHEHRNLPSVVFTIPPCFTFQARYLKSYTVFTQRKASKSAVFSRIYKNHVKKPNVIIENVFLLLILTKIISFNVSQVVNRSNSRNLLIEIWFSFVNRQKNKKTTNDSTKSRCSTHLRTWFF